MPADTERNYAYLKVPPVAALRPCVGLVLAGMATRARVGVGGLEEAVEVLESLHSANEPTRYRFWMEEDRVVAEVEEGDEEWHTVVELVS